MSKFLIIFSFCVLLFPCNSMEEKLSKYNGKIEIKEECSSHVGSVKNIIEGIHSHNIIMNWCKNELIKVRTILEKSTITDKELEKIQFIILTILPEFSGENEKILRKVLSIAIFNLLKSNVYNFITRVMD